MIKEDIIKGIYKKLLSEDGFEGSEYFEDIMGKAVMVKYLIHNIDVELGEHDFYLNEVEKELIDKEYRIIQKLLDLTKSKIQDIE